MGGGAPYPPLESFFRYPPLEPFSPYPPTSQVLDLLGAPPVLAALLAALAAPDAALRAHALAALANLARSDVNKACLPPSEPPSGRIGW